MLQTEHHCRHCNLRLTPDVKSARSIDHCVDCYIENPTPKREDIPLTWLIEKSKQCTAYLQGEDTENPKHPDHIKNLQRALDRAKDVVIELTEYLESMEGDLCERQSERNAKIPMFSEI